LRQNNVTNHRVKDHSHVAAVDFDVGGHGIVYILSGSPIDHAIAFAPDMRYWSL
jgi:hypothetical protein